MQEEKQRSAQEQQGRPGKRGPVRDEIGEADEVGTATIPDEKQVAG